MYKPGLCPAWLQYRLLICGDIMVSVNSGNKYRLILLFILFVYIANIAAKNLYTAEIVEIIKHFEGSTKAQVSLATTWYFFAYAIFQIVISIVSKKINIVKTLFYTTLISVFITALIPCCNQLWQVYVLFFLNGMLQAITWPGCMYCVCCYLTPKYQTTANVWLSVGFSIGFVLDYFSAALFIRFADWRFGFWTFAIIYFISDVLFYAVLYNSKQVDQESNNLENRQNNSTVINLTSVPKTEYVLIYVISCIVSFSITLSYYGISNWVTSFFYDVFKISSSNAAMISLIIPIIVAFGPVVMIFACKKVNYWRVAFFGLCVMLVFSIVAAFLFAKNIWLSLIFIILIMVCGRGIICQFGSVLALKCQRFINTTSYSAITNTCSSIGVSLSSIVFGSIIDKSGYRLFFLTVAIISTVILLFIVLLFKKVKCVK